MAAVSKVRSGNVASLQKGGVTIRKAPADDSEAEGGFIEVKDVKTPQSLSTTTIAKPMKTLLSNRKLGGGKGVGKFTKIRTRLAYSGSVSSGSGSALNTVISIDPSLSSEWTNFQQLFDEVKVMGGVMHFHVASSGGTPTDNDCAIAYDPTNGGVYTGVAGVLVADQNMLFRGVIDATTFMESPMPHTKSGFWSFKFKCPEAPSKIASNVLVDAEVCTGLWADTTNSVSPKYGYIKPYATGAGTSVIFSIYYYIVLDAEFRSRS